MAVVEELIRKEDDGTLSFGNFELDSKRNCLTLNLKEIYTK